MSNIVLITGATGSGKSTISHRVAENFPKSIHIQVDDLRDMLVKGMVPPKIEWSEEEKQQVLQQFQWARSTAIYMAKLYASRDVEVVIDDVITPDFVEQYAELFEIPDVHRTAGDSAAPAASIFLAYSFSCPQAESTPAPAPCSANANRSADSMISLLVTE